MPWVTNRDEGEHELSGLSSEEVEEDMKEARAGRKDALPNSSP